MKAMFDEPTAKILNSEKLKAFPLKSLILKWVMYTWLLVLWFLYFFTWPKDCTIVGEYIFYVLNMKLPSLPWYL